MRLYLVFLVISFVFCVVYAKGGGVRSLTESMGQEVIEIGAPIKDLPQDLEEEPSAEVDDEDDSRETTAKIPSATRKETQKVMVSIPGKVSGEKVKDIEKIDNVPDDEEARIEKEIADIYKDTDYKGDSSEVKMKQVGLSGTKKPIEGKTKPIVNNTIDGTKPIENLNETKPIERSRNSFKFQPDRAEDVEKWRTSVDDIACVKGATKKMSYYKTPQTPQTAKPGKPGSAFRSTVNVFLLLLTSLLF